MTTGPARGTRRDCATALLAEIVNPYRKAFAISSEGANLLLKDVDHDGTMKVLAGAFSQRET